MMERSKQMKQIAAVVLFFAVLIGLMLSYPIFAMSSQQKVLKAVVNTMKKMETDYDSTLSDIGVNQNFSKEVRHELEIRLLHPELNELFMNVENLKFFRSRDEIEKFYQFGLSLGAKKQEFDIFQIQFDDEKTSCVFPFIFDKKLTLSSKNFGRDISEVERKLYSTEYVQRDADMSFSAIDKFVREFYDAKFFWEKNYKFFEALLKDAEIIQEGDVYSFTISDKNLQKVTDMIFDDIPDNHEIFIAMRSDYFIDRYRYQIKSMLQDMSLDVSARIPNGLVKEMHVILKKEGKRFGALAWKIYSKKEENIFSNMVFELEDDVPEEKIAILNVLERQPAYFKNTVSVFSNREKISGSEKKIVLEIDARKQKDNFRCDAVYKYKNGSKFKIHWVGDYKHDAHSIDIEIPKVVIEDDHYLADKSEMFGISYRITNQNVDGRDFKKEEVYLPHLNKAELESLFADLEKSAEKIFSKIFEGY